MAISLVTIIVELGTLVYLQKGQGKTNCRNTSREAREEEGRVKAVSDPLVRF